MKKTLTLFAPLGAAVCFVLRWLQLRHSFDALGLIPRGDALSLVLYGATALAAAGILAACLRVPRGAPGNVPASRVRWQVMLSFAAPLILVVAGAMDGLFGLAGGFAPSMDLLCGVLLLATVCEMAVTGVFHLQGHSGSLLGACIPVVYLAVQLVRDYRAWALDPLVPHFAFHLLFLVCAMLAAFHLAAFRVGRGKRRLSVFYAACAALFAGPVAASFDRALPRALAFVLYLYLELIPCLDAPPVPDEAEGPGKEPSHDLDQHS